MVVLPAPFGPRKPVTCQACIEADVVDGGEAAVALCESFHCDHGDHRGATQPPHASAAGWDRSDQSRGPRPPEDRRRHATAPTRALEHTSHDLFQPRLTRWGHTWRLVVMLLVSRLASALPLPAAWRSSHLLVVVDLAARAHRIRARAYRRRRPLTVASSCSRFVLLGDRGRARRCSRRSRWPPGADWQLAVIALANVAGAVYYMISPASRERALVGHSSSCGHHAGRPGVGHVHRLAPRAVVDPALARRAGRGRAGPAGLAGPDRRAGPDRPRDARRARPPDLPGLDARQRPLVPDRPRRRALRAGPR